LLSYLALEGPQERRFLAELFWPDAANGLASLSTALYRIGKSTDGAIDADDLRAWSLLTSDAQELLTQLERGGSDFDRSLYRGPFLAGIYLPGWSSELEEWIYQTRERIARRVQQAFLKLAEEAAALGRFQEAGEQAAAAHRLPGAGEPEVEELERYFILFTAADHPAAALVGEQAQEYDLSLSQEPTTARAQLRRVFVGRQAELERLAGLSSGQWAWVRGGAGIGKTSLLQRLPGRYLPARAGLPYATLEPLEGAEIAAGEEAMLRRLLRWEVDLNIDDWELIDAESRALLQRLRKLRPHIRVVIASSAPPALPVEVLLELNSLPAEALAAHGELWAATGGVPQLVGAHLRGEPLAEALASVLQGLTQKARDVYLSLSLLEQPDLGLVRRALELSAAEMTGALETLLAAGLAAPSGRVWPRQLARDYLAARPGLLGNMALRSARLLRGIEAFLLYRSARNLWEEGDLPEVRRAYLAWAKQLLERGFSQQAADILAEAPPDEEVRFQLGYALERAGKFKEALGQLGELPPDPRVLALTASLYWRLSENERARQAAQRALNGDMWSRAKALTVLGNLAQTQGSYQEAIGCYRKAALLWQGLNDSARHIDVLNNTANTEFLRDEQPEGALKVYRQALAAAGDNLILHTRVSNNMAVMWERLGELDRAVRIFEETISLAQESGAVAIAARAWNNLAALHHRNDRPEEAATGYAAALRFAHLAGDQRILGIVLANSAELEEDYLALEEALRFLEETGHAPMAGRYRARLGAKLEGGKTADRPTP